MEDRMIDIGMRSKVGHPLMFDILGAHQFCALIRFGLREYHSILDFGCGCLRGGRLIIPYLRKGKYIGIEPNKGLVVYGLKNEISRGVLEEKKPRIFLWDDFKFAGRIPSVDYILAQSILTHAGIDIVSSLFDEAYRTLNSGGRFVGTFFDSGNYPSEDEKGWFGNLIARYKRDHLVSIARNAGFTKVEIFDLGHPAGQTWFNAKRY